MDLILTSLFLVTCIAIFWFLREFTKARREILEERTKEKVTLVLETVDNGTENSVILVYDFWTNRFIGQGNSNEEVLAMLYKKFENETISIVYGNLAYDITLTYKAGSTP